VEHTKTLLTVKVTQVDNLTMTIFNISSIQTVSILQLVILISKVLLSLDLAQGEKVILLLIRWGAWRKRGKVRARKESQLSLQQKEESKALHLNHINRLFQGKVIIVKVKCLKKDQKESILRKVNLEIKVSISNKSRHFTTME
jgi:hypothetical protein